MIDSKPVNSNRKTLYDFEEIQEQMIASERKGSLLKWKSTLFEDGERGDGDELIIGESIEETASLEKM